MWMLLEIDEEKNCCVLVLRDFSSDNKRHTKVKKLLKKGERDCTERSRVVRELANAHDTFLQNN